jgi:glycosyltransferase involved in cell wall biosynthesis
MYIIHLGTSGFPIGNAAMQRIRLTFKGLKNFGYLPLVINKHSIQTKHFDKKVNRYEGIPFVFTSVKHSRPNSFIVRNINRCTGFVGEFLVLLKLRKKIHTAIVYTPSFGELVYYKLLSKLIGFKVIIQYVELRSSIPERDSFLTKLNDRFFDNYFYRYCDGVIAISEFLMKHVRGKSKKLPLIKIPAMCDFTEFDGVVAHKGPQYIMYCGTIEYLEVIGFLLDIFVALKKGNIYTGEIILVISGNNQKNQDRLQQKMDGMPYANDIIIKKSIPYAELLSLYKGADLLMIPLRDTLQDKARFPHKIGEYTASKKTILSTNIGELEFYFKNGESAILAAEYTVESYQKVLTSIFLNKTDLNKIGAKGHQIGLENFEYLSQINLLKTFIEAL